ncbi:MAG: ligase-associated DNA damage response endonuclease PdeM, partial [Bacteroidota bacterium]
DATLFWPDRQTLFVADLHLGKASTFQARGVPMPGGDAKADLDVLSDALMDTNARRLVILGDLYHTAAGRRDGTTDDALTEWRTRHPNLDVLLVLGNHDAHAGLPPSGLDFEIAEEPFEDAPFAFRHHPEPSEAGYTLAGHLHPGVVLSAGREQVRLPAFVFGPRVGVLPAFGALTGMMTVRPATGDRVFVIAEGDVVEV